MGKLWGRTRVWYTDGMTINSLPVIQEAPVLERRADGHWLVAGTDLPFELFMGCYHRDETPEEIVEGFPMVPLSTAHRLIAYYLDHPREVDAWLEEIDREADDLYRHYDGLHPSEPIRAAILARGARISAAPPE